MAKPTSNTQSSNQDSDAARAAAEAAAAEKAAAEAAAEKAAAEAAAEAAAAEKASAGKAEKLPRWIAVHCEMVNPLTNQRFPQHQITSAAEDKWLRVQRAAGKFRMDE